VGPKHPTEEERREPAHRGNEADHVGAAQVSVPGGRQLERPGVRVGRQQAVGDRVAEEHAAQREAQHQGRPGGPAG